MLPLVLDLPEGLNEAEFKRRFIAVGAPAYQRVAKDIERRLDQLALYK